MRLKLLCKCFNFWFPQDPFKENLNIFRTIRELINEENLYSKYDARGIYQHLIPSAVLGIS
jgi:hypothetical protein